MWCDRRDDNHLRGNSIHHMARRVSWVNQLSLSADPYGLLLVRVRQDKLGGSSWFRCNTAANDSMEDMPSTVCVSGTHRILVDVMVA